MTVLARRKMSVERFISEKGITSKAQLLEECKRLGVTAPKSTENIFPSTRRKELPAEEQKVILEQPARYPAHVRRFLRQAKKHLNFVLHTPTSVTVMPDDNSALFEWVLGAGTDSERRATVLFNGELSVLTINSQETDINLTAVSSHVSNWDLLWWKLNNEFLNNAIDEKVSSVKEKNVSEESY